MQTIGKWIRSTVQQVLDPDREERIQELAALIYKSLQSAGDNFSIRVFSAQVNYTERDIEIAKRKVYHTLLNRAWKDDKVAPEELKTLRWVIQRLEIPSDEATSIQHEIARDRFSNALAKAMDDGILDNDEAVYLENIARSVECTLGDFVGQYFHTEGESFLRGVFAACTEGGVLADDVWERLLQTTQRLGLSKKALVAAILPQAERFVEHVLADAKSDGELSEEEEAQLMQLIETIGLPQSSRSYIHQSIAALRTIRVASQGKLPVISSPSGIAIRSGEIVHLHEPATWYQRRILKSGDRWDEHVGSLTITDNRLLFSSNTKSFDVRFARIARHAGETGVIRLQRMEKPESVIRLAEDEPVAYAILEGAVAFPIRLVWPTRVESHRDISLAKFGSECGNGMVDDARSPHNI